MLSISLSDVCKVASPDENQTTLKTKGETRLEIKEKQL